MLLSEKIAFLCHLTNTSNKQLATALSVDPSLISRIKSGRRTLSRDSQHLVFMGNYFAKKCTSDFQRNALSETIGQTRIKLVMKKEVLADIIAQWLSDTSPTSFQNMQRIIDDQGFQDCSAVVPDHVEDIDFGEKINCYTYYGNNGKRVALHNLVLYLLKYGTPCTVFIASDESLDWLMECPTFLDIQKNDLLRLTDAGFSFKRIAPKYADIEETVAAFTRWLPIYMRAKCETFYYPRIRDNLFHRTAVVAPGQIALSSSSVGHQRDNSLTYLYTDPYVANNHASEFLDYLKKCVPMANSYTHLNTDKTVLDCIIHYLGMSGSMLTQFYGLPALFTPPGTIKKIFGDDMASIDAFTKLAQRCHARLRKETIIDIITLDSPQNIRDGKVLCTASRLVPNVPAYYYSMQEYIEHLKTIILLMDEYPDYTVIVNDNSSEMRSTICTLETGVCYIIKINDPVTLFEISDQNIAACAKEYILNLLNIGMGRQFLQRKKTIEQIEALITTLKNMENSEADIVFDKPPMRKNKEKPANIT